MSTITLRSVKGSGLTNNEIDANFTNLNTDKVEAAQTATLTNKTLALSSNTISGTLAQFNTALTDGDFATIAGTETLTNKTLTNPSYSGATADGGTVTTIDINGGTIDGTVIGGSSAAAGSFTTLSASGGMINTQSGGSIINNNTAGTTAGAILVQDSGSTAGGLVVYGPTHATVANQTWVKDYRAGSVIKLAPNGGSTAIGEVSSTGLAVTGAVSATGRMTSTDGVFTLGNAYFNVSGTTRGQILTDATNLDLDAKNATHVRLQVATTTVADVTSAGLAVTGAVSASGRISATSDTTSPTDGSTYLYKSSAGGVVSGYQVILETGSAGSRTTKATLDASGNLGLGVTPSAWRTTERGLEVAGSGGSMGALTNTFSETRLYNNAYVNTTPASVYKTTGGASMYRQDTAGAHSWHSAASGTAGTTFTFTQSLAVGLGTTLALQGATSVTGCGISFPATQVASSDANTLDDYEEGTWTPTINFVTPGNLSVTYSIQAGRYTKIGNAVHISARVILSAFTHTTASGALMLGGLPFVPSSSVARIALGTLVSSYTKANYTQITGVVASSDTNIYFEGTGSGQTVASMDTSCFPSATVFGVNVAGTYFI